MSKRLAHAMPTINAFSLCQWYVSDEELQGYLKRLPDFVSADAHALAKQGGAFSLALIFTPKSPKGCIAHYEQETLQ